MYDPEVSPANVRSVKVATPLTALIDVVPPSTPPLATTTMVAVALVTVLLLASAIRTTGWVASTAPDAAPTGCVVTRIFAATPGVKVILAEIPLPLQIVPSVGKTLTVTEPAVVEVTDATAEPSAPVVTEVGVTEAVPAVLRTSMARPETGFP